MRKFDPLSGPATLRWEDKPLTETKSENEQLIKPIVWRDIIATWVDAFNRIEKEETKNENC
jgi:hypothetical protein